MPRHLNGVALVLITPVLLTLGLLYACNPPPAEKPSNSATSQNLPFDRSPRTGGISPSESFIPSDTKLPEGTPIPIRLQTALSSASSHAGDNFYAVVDEPVLVNGQTLVGRGTAAAGRVLEAKPSVHSEGSLEPGYLRIVLVSLNVRGRRVSIETSSIFAKGGPRDERNPAPAVDAHKLDIDKNRDIELGVDRRLSFRLAQAVDLQ
jgi:hypothetical protein